MHVWPSMLSLAYTNTSSSVHHISMTKSEMCFSVVVVLRKYHSFMESVQIHFHTRWAKACFRFHSVAVPKDERVRRMLWYCTNYGYIDFLTNDGGNAGW